MNRTLALTLALSACGGDFDHEKTCDDKDVSCGTVTVPARHDLPDDGRRYDIGYRRMERLGITVERRVRR